MINPPCYCLLFLPDAHCPANLYRMNPKETPGFTQTQLFKATIPEPCLLPQVARSNFSWIQEVARQLRGAGKAARAKQPQTFLLQNSAVWVLTLSPFSRAQCPAGSGPSFQKQCVLPAFHGHCIQRGKKREILQWSEMQRKAITKICSNVGFLQGEGLC